MTGLIGIAQADFAGSTAAAAPLQKRLLIVTHTGEIGGAEHILLEIAQHYRTRCHVLSFESGPLLERLAGLGVQHSVIPAGSRVLRIRRDARRLRAAAAAPAVLGLAVRLARIARRYDVVYANSQKAAVVSMLAAKLARRKLVWHMHDILSSEHFATLQRRVVTLLANHAASRVIVVSQAARRSFIEGGGNPARAVVVHNGADPADFLVPGDFDAAGMRRSLGLGNGPLIGLFGRISPWKGQHVLLRALRELPGVHALIVGDALFGETDYRNELHRLANELGVTERVHWLGQRNDVPTLMRIVDVVCHTSTSPEPFGRVILEGMLALRPVIATDHGASRELLGDDSMQLVAPDNPHLLAQAIHRILAIPNERRQDLGQKNRARAETQFSLHTMLTGIEQVVALDSAA